MKPVNVKSNRYIDFNEENNEEDPKLVIIYEYQNTKTFLQKVTLQIALKKVLWLKNLKRTVPWTYIISDLKSEDTVGTFYKK